MDKIKVGILGFGHGHVNLYCSQWRQRPKLGVRLVAGWDHNAERAATCCANQEIEVAASIEALVNRDDIDVIVISSETSMHADFVEHAAAAGKAIALQKPMALTMDQADRIVAAVERAGVPFTMAWQMRVDPHNIKAKELLKSGDFGRVFQVRRRHCLTTQYMKNFDKSWHVKPEFNRDIFSDDAAHPIDFIYWLLGMPVSVSAEMGSLLNPAIPNDNAVAVFRYADGSFGEVSSSFVAVAGENTLEILCEHGAIIGNYGDGPSCMVPRPAGGIQLKWFIEGMSEWTVSDIPDIRDQAVRIAGLAAPLAEFFKGNCPAIATAGEGRDVLKMTLACYESVNEGKRVEIR